MASSKSDVDISGTAVHGSTDTSHATVSSTDKGIGLVMQMTYGVSCVLLFVGVILGIAGDIVPSLAVICVGAAMLFVPNIDTRWLPQISIGKTIVVQRPKQSILGMIYSKLLRLEFFASMSHNIRQTSLGGAISTGQLVSPGTTSRQIVLAFIIALFIAGTISVMGVVLFTEPLFLISFAIPVLVRAYPYLSNVLNSSDVSSKYDSELAYFLAYLQISTMSGFGLFDSMMRIAGKGIIHAIEKDTAMLKKWIKLDGYTESMAINRLATKHVHKTFQLFLYSYYEISKSNPSGLNDYVSNAADSEFVKITERDERRVGKFSNVFMLGAMAMIMAPVMLLVMMFIETSSITIQYIMVTIFAIPIIFTLYVFVSSSSISDVKLYSTKLSILGVIPGIIWYGTYNDAPSAVSLAVAIPCIWNGLLVSNQIARWRSAADGFPVFIRDLIERIKVDANFIVSISKVVHGTNQAKYGRFADIVNTIRTRQYVVSDVQQPMFYDDTLNSRRLQMLLFILETVFDGGHKKSISSLERIYRFSVKLNEIKNSADDALKMSSVLLFAASPIFFVTMLGLSSMLISFTSNIPDISHISGINAESMKLFERPDYSGVLYALKPAVMIMSVCAGVIVSRVAYSSLIATLPVGICTSISFVILAGWEVFFDIINGLVDDFLG